MEKWIIPLAFNSFDCIREGKEVCPEITTLYTLSILLIVFMRTYYERAKSLLEGALSILLIVFILLDTTERSLQATSCFQFF